MKDPTSKRPERASDEGQEGTQINDDTNSSGIKEETSVQRPSNEEAQKGKVGKGDEAYIRKFS